MSTGALLRAVFSLEARRTIALAGLGRVSGAESELEAVDAELREVLAALEARGVAYPAHALARHYGLSEAEYLILQLALLPHHGEPAAHRVTGLLGESSERPRLSHALALIAHGHDDWDQAARQLRQMPLLSQKLVELRADQGGDPELHVGQAVSELLGLAG